MTDEQLALAIEARDDGIARAERGAPDDWATYAWDFMLDYLETHPYMHSDDLWRAGLKPTRENRALGPLVMRARRLGLITASGVQRVTVKAHAQRHTVWRSLIYGKAAG